MTEGRHLIVDALFVRIEEIGRASVRYFIGFESRSLSLLSISLEGLVVHLHERVFCQHFHHFVVFISWSIEEALGGLVTIVNWGHAVRDSPPEVR